MFRFQPRDRSYSDCYFDVIEEGTVASAPTPLSEYKLLPGDVINEAGDIVQSPWRSEVQIPGVLVTSGKTYGRVNDRLLPPWRQYRNRAPRGRYLYC